MTEIADNAAAAQPPLVVGVDVGGTKTAAAVVDASGRLFGRTQTATQLGGAEPTLRGVAATIHTAVAAAGVALSDITAVGLGVPGKVDPVRGLGVYSVNVGWHDAPVVAYLSDALGRPCAVENDVGAAALGESHYGAGRGVAAMVYLSLGTGIASRLVLDGKLYRGMSGLAGEIGHTVFDPRGPLCKCGARGCLEAIASGPGIAARGQAAVDEWQPTQLAEMANDAGGPVTTRMVFEAAAAGDAVAQGIVEATGVTLAEAVQQLIMFFDPQLVVLGGGLVGVGDALTAPIYQDLARRAAESTTFAEMYAPQKVRLTALGNDVALLGAAALVAP
ncbi:MAG: ROK family protein [Anaerolineae bacterium]